MAAHAENESVLCGGSPWTDDPRWLYGPFTQAGSEVTNMHFGDLKLLCLYELNGVNRKWTGVCPSVFGLFFQNKSQVFILFILVCVNLHERQTSGTR